MKAKTILKNNHGFSILLMMGMLSLALTLFSVLTEQMNLLGRFSVSTDKRLQIASIVSNANYFINQGGACNQMGIVGTKFEKVSSTEQDKPISLTVPNEPKNFLIPEKGGTIAGATVKDFSIKQLTPIGVGISPGTDAYLATSVLDIQRPDTTLGARSLSYTLSFVLDIDAGGVVQSCRSNVSSVFNEIDACNAVGGSFNANWTPKCRRDPKVEKVGSSMEIVDGAFRAPLVSTNTCSSGFVTGFDPNMQVRCFDLVVDDQVITKNSANCTAAIVSFDPPIADPGSQKSAFCPAGRVLTGGDQCCSLDFAGVRGTRPVTLGNTIQIERFVAGTVNTAITEPAPMECPKDYPLMTASRAFPYGAFSLGAAGSRRVFTCASVAYPEPS